MKNTPPPLQHLLLPLPTTVGIVFAVITASITRSWLYSLVALLGSAALSAAVAFFSADKVAEAAIGAELVDGYNKTVVESHLEELCARTGVTQPDVYTVGPGMPAIASYGRKEARIVITDDIVDVYSSVELEAVFARELVRIRSGKTAIDTLAVTFLAIPFGWLGSFAKKLMARARGEGSVAQTDLDTIEVTRYPPALTAALSKMRYPVPTHMESVKHLWAVPTPEGKPEPGVFTLDERLSLLREI